MSTTDLEVCNFALGLLQQPSIVSLNDASPAARSCKQFYALKRDALLRAHPWNFAQTRARLVPLVAAPDFGFAYQYTLPGDCVRLTEVVDHWPTDYRLEGRSILTDQGDHIDILYNKRVTEAEFDPLFTEALAWEVALVMCAKLLNSASQAQFMAEYKERKVLPLSKIVDAQENLPEPLPPDILETCRA